MLPAAHLSPLQEQGQAGPSTSSVQPGPSTSNAVLAFHAAQRAIQDAAEAQQFAQQVRQNTAQQAQLIRTELNGAAVQYDRAIAEATETAASIESAGRSSRHEARRQRLSNLARQRLGNALAAVSDLRGQKQALQARMALREVELLRAAMQQVSTHRLAHLRPMQDLLLELAGAYTRLAQGERKPYHLLACSAMVPACFGNECSLNARRLHCWCCLLL
jgi:hypothetical protein